jgi:hypothetical protein
MNPVILALVRPVAVCLVAGGLRFLQDYQQTTKLVPALVDGAIVAGETAAGMLGVTGAVAGVANARTAATAALPAPKAPA